MREIKHYNEKLLRRDTRLSDIKKFSEEVYQKWKLWEERKLIEEYYLINGESLNKAMDRLNCTYDYCCELFKMFGLERRPNDYDPTLIFRG